MVVLLIVSLFTARIVFNALGINDYGLYNVVGGIIVFFTFLNNGLATATRRYITADIAEGNLLKGRHTFNVCLKTHFIIAAVILFLGETVGLWCVLNVLNIPEGREYAAMIVYQISIVTAIFSIVQSPYGSAIVAHEKMSIYAYFTIFDALAKLMVCFFIKKWGGDKLVFYAFLIMGVAFFNLLMYVIYCLKNIKICVIEKTKDRQLLKEIFQFMSWSVLGQAAVVGTNQGVSLLVNVYHNVAVNAAMGVSNTITQVVSQF